MDRYFDYCKIYGKRPWIDNCAHINTGINPCKNFVGGRYTLKCEQMSGACFACAKLQNPVYNGASREK